MTRSIGNENSSSGGNDLFDDPVPIQKKGDLVTQQSSIIAHPHRLFWLLCILPPIVFSFFEGWLAASWFLSAVLAPRLSKEYSIVSIIVGTGLIFLPWFMVISWSRFICSMSGIVHFSRVLELMRKKDYFDHTPWWFRYLYVHVYHDLSKLKDVADLPTQSKEMLKKFATETFYLITTAICIHIWSKHCTWMLDYNIAVYYTIRWSLSMFAAYHGPLLVDYFYRSIFIIGWGKDVDCTSDRPIQSKTVSEFWASRWNLVIQQVLHSNIFRPFYNRGWKFAAVSFTFIGSALFHTYPVLLSGLSMVSVMSMFSFFIVHFFIVCFEYWSKVDYSKVFPFYSWWVVALFAVTSPLFLEPICLIFD
eukprot:TRINITY_DN3720_c0_g1_i1.p1 TRINITY_DN3720_c0_g1~~TRINITY_DN3720_c0_g1_i1.p1  ORF type:complete len:362 (-),score=36.48 TRINITY_DN3720_c0_g1_i1:23-1108(-)